MAFPFEGLHVETDLPVDLSPHQFENLGEKTPRTHGGLRALVVAGEPEVAEEVAAWLRRWGHYVRVAVDEASALAGAERDPPDVVLLVGALPEASPWNLARRLPRHPAGRSPFLIVLVGDLQDVDRRRSGEAGVDLVLVRPVDLDLLRGVLRRFARLLTPPELVGVQESESKVTGGLQPALA